jgi:hypothetical protein
VPRHGQHCDKCQGERYVFHDEFTVLPVFDMQDIKTLADANASLEASKRRAKVIRAYIRCDCHPEADSKFG